MTEADGRGVVESARAGRGGAALGRPSIDNVDELCSRGMAALRAQALGIAAVGLAACDAGAATAEAVELTGPGVAIDGVEHPLADAARLVVLGSGKASVAIAAALERSLGERLDAGLVIARRGEEAELDRIEVIGADHPLPSEGSARAAERLVRIASELGDGDLVLACFTGGSSALASLPPSGVSVAEKRRLHELLLGSGMPIVEVNTVRKHVSGIKGGRLATRISPARIANLTVSDVAGDVLDAVTDPTVQDTSAPTDAVAILRDYGLWGSVPESIRRHLRTPAAASPDLADIEISTTLLVTGQGACEAMALEAAALGLEPVTISTSFEGEAREVGRFVANLARSSLANGAPFPTPSVLVACGGESTVTLASGSRFGAGGPSLEAAIAAAFELDGMPAAAVFLDTDGSDGGTDAAGAVVDGTTVGRARERGVDLRGALHSHRSREPLEALGDLVISGPTGTNVNDLLVVALGVGEDGLTMVGEAMIQLESLTKRFGSLNATDDVSLEIGAGEFFSLLGPSGCGKTTTLRMIAGFEEPSAGRIVLDGRDVTYVSPTKRNVNMVFQDYALFPHMTVVENVAFGLKLKRVGEGELRARVSEMLGLMQLGGYEDRRPGQLSGGQRQRVALARALVNRPTALLLDEPLGALDLKLRKEMQAELKRIQRETGTAFVYVTHDQEEALTMSDRIAVMDAGRVEQVDAPRALYERPATAFVADFIGVSNTLSLRVDRREGGRVAMELGDGMRLIAPDPGEDAGRDRVTITVRPEKITVHPDPADEGSRVRGTVRDQVYLGSLTQLTVELETGEALIVHLLNDDRAPAAIDPGRELVLGWAMRHSFVIGSGLPRPASEPAAHEVSLA